MKQYNHKGIEVIPNAHKIYRYEYMTWVSIIQRCHNSNRIEYKNYGAKGIHVCDRWRNSFKNFHEDMGSRPENCSSIDRIDATKGYSPDNCRWSNLKEQARNKTKGHKYITFQNETFLLCEWAEKTGINARTINNRLRLGWSIEKSLTTPVDCSKKGSKTKVFNKDIPEYTTWGDIKQRCYNPNSIGYRFYGGKGITICDRWMESFKDFYMDMGAKPTPKHSIDRIDGTKGYSPDNCRWATKKEQSRNLSTNHYLTYNEETFCISEWAEKTGISEGTILRRIKMGWPVGDSLSSPTNAKRNRILKFNNESLTIKEWSEKLNLNPNTIRDRLRSGWTIEKTLSTPIKKYESF